MREDETVAEATGVNTIVYKLMAFSMGAVFGSVAGAFYAAKIGVVFPQNLDILISINALALIILGGMGSITGVIVGAFMLVGLPGLLREFAEYQLLIFGAVLVAMMLFRPEGLVPNRSRRAELHEDEGGPEPDRARWRRRPRSRHARGETAAVHGEDRIRPRAGDRRRVHPARRQVMTAATPANDNILVASKVTMRFGGLVANKDVDFAIPRRGIVSLIGPNGAGKTTFFNQLTGMLEPTSGDIVFDGTSTVGLTPHEIVEIGVARTFQNIRLFGDMTTLENVMVGRHVRMKAHWWDSVVRTPATRAEEAATAARSRELLDIVGLPRRYEEEWARNLPVR